jgi:hypothetical protein
MSTDFDIDSKGNSQCPHCLKEINVDEIDTDDCETDAGYREIFEYDRKMCPHCKEDFSVVSVYVFEYRSVQE